MKCFFSRGKILNTKEFVVYQGLNVVDWVQHLVVWILLGLSTLAILLYTDTTHW